MSYLVDLVGELSHVLREFTQASNPLSGENIWFAGKIRSACDAAAVKDCPASKLTG
ncbi:MAG TPA: hypothetical protein VHP35_20560 [Terriglobia bacterium]|nr:hypothetical protein [Terriglobia bacterium]